MAAGLGEVHFVDARLGIFLSGEDGGMHTIARVLQIRDHPFLNPLRETRAVPDDIQPGVADDFAEKHRHLRRPDFDCTDHSGLTHICCKLDGWIDMLPTRPLLNCTAAEPRKERSIRSIDGLP